MDILSDGSAWLASQLSRHASRPLEFRRGEDCCQVRGTVAIGHRNRMDAYGGIVRVELWQVVVERLALRLQSGLVVPQRGDTFSDTASDEERVYAVFPPPDGKAVFEWLDSSRVLMVVYCQLIELHQ